jgi:O-acetylhomoserine (thiol)-lyase
MGIEVTFLEEMTPDHVQKSIQKNTKMVYFETIGNPKGDVMDIEAIANVAHAEHVPVVVDNTFAPTLCKPIAFGADVVIHSLTKWIGGHGTSIGGILVDAGTFDWSSGRFPSFTEPDPSYHGMTYWPTFSDLPGMGNITFAIKARVDGMRNLGPCASPQNSFYHLQGCETLPLRMERHCQSTLALAEWLKRHPKVEWVSYTGLEDHPYHEIAKKVLTGGFGAVLGFGVKGGREASQRFIDRVEMVSHLANVGDAKTLVLHPASTSHQQMSDETLAQIGVSPDFVRVAVGLEDIEDIKKDFDKALN